MAKTDNKNGHMREFLLLFATDYDTIIIKNESRAEILWLLRGFCVTGKS